MDLPLLDKHMLLVPCQASEFAMSPYKNTKLDTSSFDVKSISKLLVSNLVFLYDGVANRDT